ncbi:MAG: hypothetical protein ACT4P2_02415 [Pseudomonadota bacterium]
MATYYNERSWAIDVISEINALAATRSGAIRRAGGERTLMAMGRSLFPDVMLFGDVRSGRILQGWELKMPDTRITDAKLLANAEEKAKHLGLDSFVVWNVVTAQLYKQDGAGTFGSIHTWRSLDRIGSRRDVERCRADWVALLHEIIETLEEFFARGTLSAQTPAATLSSGALVDVVLDNTGAVAQTLADHARSDRKFRAQAELWWAATQAEFRGDEKWPALARVNLVHWLNRFVFAHYLKRFAAAARRIDSVRLGVTLAQGRRVFDEITRRCDFLNVFVPSPGDNLIDKGTWSELVQINEFLRDLRLEDIDQEILQDVLERTIAQSRRKAAGQFATPRALADLLVRLTVDNAEGDFLDPFCGTGTIARAAFNLKRELCISASDALDTVWASDKFSFPLQVTTLALSQPSSVGQPLRVFRRDAFDLAVGGEVELVDPGDGSSLNVGLPTFESIACNPPFVQFEDLDLANPRARLVNDFITERVGPGATLPSKSDLFAYVPFALWRLLTDSARLGIIVSNTWLGTNWGRQFRKLLSRFYRIEAVVTSGRGRWFAQTAVVTNLLILGKRGMPSAPAPDEMIVFAILQRRIEDLEDPDLARRVASRIVLGGADSDDVQVRRVRRVAIGAMEELGLGWTACCADLDWIGRLSGNVVPTRTLFNIHRGERRGWDPLFYPTGDHGIEPTFLRPVLKSSTACDGLVCRADRDAFCCSTGLDKLRQRGHRGALRWIRRFERAVNEKGKRLPEALARSGMRWYEMRDETVADLVAPINYGERLFVARLQERAFVNQRLIRFTRRSPALDIELCHALLNSVVGLFYLEALGFGRGLGALDLNATKLRAYLFMLDPMRLSPMQADEIKARFAALLRRPVGHIAEELDRDDRGAFDQAVLAAFGLTDIHHRIKNSLRTLLGIRMAVSD